MTLWCWLENNSLQIQALVGVAAVFVAAIVGWVAWKQKGAAEAQASAAVKQTIAAEVQADAARQQVAAARQQTETALLIADRQTTPHISIAASKNHEGQIIQRGITVLNNGTGPALNLEVKYNDGLPGNDDLKIAGVALVVGDSLSVWVTDEQRGAQTGLRLTYETIFGTKYVLEFQWNGLNSHSVNQRLSIASGTPKKLDSV
jgi:hypothetical protein